MSLAGANHGKDDHCPFVPDNGGAQDPCPAYSTDAEGVVQLTLNGQPCVLDVDETRCGLGGGSAGVAVVAPDASRRIGYFTVRLLGPDPAAIGGSTSKTGGVAGAGAERNETPRAAPGGSTRRAPAPRSWRTSASGNC